MLEISYSRPPNPGLRKRKKAGQGDPDPWTLVSCASRSPMAGDISLPGQ